MARRNRTVKGAWDAVDRIVREAREEAKKEKRKYEIYHRDREYARISGDPCLGLVEASSKEEAERKAIAQGFNLPTGAWAVLKLRY